MTNDTIERQDARTFERMTRTRGTQKQERVKRSVIAREYGVVQDALKRSEREPEKF
jgi:hypothetical protein